MCGELWYEVKCLVTGPQTTQDGYGEQIKLSEISKSAGLYILEIPMINYWHQSIVGVCTIIISVCIW